MRKLIFICDRCNKQFLPPVVRDFDIVSEFCGRIDLCKECTKELISWLKIEKTTESEDLNIDGS